MSTPEAQYLPRLLTEEELQEMIQRAAYDKNLLLPYVLAEVNDIRLAMAIGEGKLEALPKGVIEDTHQCVLARALSNGWTAVVDGVGITLHLEPDPDVPADIGAVVITLSQLGYDARAQYRSVFIAHTKCTGRLVEWFDQGFFPDLILRDEDYLREPV